MRTGGARRAPEAPTQLPLPEKTLGEALLEKERERERRERERTPLKLHLGYGSDSSAPPGEAILDDRTSAWGGGTPLHSSNQTGRRPMSAVRESSEGFGGLGSASGAVEGSLGSWGAAAASGPASRPARSLGLGLSGDAAEASEAVERDISGIGGEMRSGYSAVLGKSKAWQEAASTVTAVGVDEGSKVLADKHPSEARSAFVGVGVGSESMDCAHDGVGRGGGGGEDDAGAASSWKDEEPVGGRTEEEAADGNGSPSTASPLVRHSSWGRRLREPTTLKVPSEEYGSVVSALAAAVSGDIIEVRACTCCCRLRVLGSSTETMHV